MEYEYIQRIPSHYVGKNCIQIWISHFKDAITILNSDGMTYHYKPNSHLFVNKYTSDKRKEQFPYSSIPSYRGRVGLKRVEYINQLVDFGRVYIKIADGMVVEHFAVKDGEEALFVSKYILPNQKNEIMNRTQVNELLKTANGGMYSFDGTLYEKISFVSDERVLEWYKEYLITMREEEIRFRSGSNPTDKDLTEFLYKSMEKMTPDDVDLEPIMMDDLILVSIDDNEVKSIKSIILKFKGSDKYMVEISDFPITIYSLEHMKQLEQTNFKKTQEPKFYSFLNPQIDKNEIKKGKQLILQKK